MKCLRCSNSNPALFFEKDGKHYCRACLDFGLCEAGKEPFRPELKKRVIHINPVLEFELTTSQKSVSAKALQALQQGKDILIYAAAGAGKTEITLESICWFLSQGKKVCFAISRRQVVIEIAARLQKNFPALQVVPVCQGFTRITDGDLIVCTTHQLYRYPSCFDLLILDELDAFPYAGNPVLEAIAEKSCCGVKMLLSATPDSKSLERIAQGKMELAELFIRPHKKPLCVPQTIYGPKWKMVFQIVRQCRNMVKNHKQVLVYVPRISDAFWMKWLLNRFVKADLIHSKSRNKDEIMDTFRSRKTEVMVCTTLLERGITVPSVQVLVYRADHRVFTAASLIQIFGRVGRTFSDPQGTGICYLEKRSASVQECIAQIKRMNAAAFGAGK